MIQLPRLSGAGRRRPDRPFPRRRVPPTGPDSRPDNLPRAVHFAATGGSRASPDELNALRETVWQTAKGEVASEANGSRASRAKLDAALGVRFAELPLLASGEALRDDFWTFMGVALAPDVVHWRFARGPPKGISAVYGTRSSGCGLRARVLDRGSRAPPALATSYEELTEDALVQITERPSIGADPVLAKAVAEAWLRAGAHHGKGAMEPVMRQAILRIRIRNEIVSLADLPTGMLAGVLDGAFGLPVEGRHRNGDTQRQPTEIPSGTPEDPTRQAERVARRIFAEAEKRRLLSPKSTAALRALQQGKLDLGRSERNALAHLLEMMHSTAVAREDVAVVRKVLPVLASPPKTRAR